MSNVIRGFRSVGIYLLPVSLLMAVGSLSIVLLYYPTPSTVPVIESPIADATSRDDQQACAEALFSAALLDALRELRPAQKTRARNRIYRYEQNPFLATEQPTLLQIEHPVTAVQNGDHDRSHHPVLIRL